MSQATWSTYTADDTAIALATSLSHGLSGGDAELRLARHGPNIVPGAKQRSGLAIFVHQFRSLIVALLVAACVVALVLGDLLEALAIVVVIALNAVIGFVTEWKAGRALSRLREHGKPMAHVRRDGVDRELLASQIVPGDIVLLGAGDRIPADGRVFAQTQLQVDEATLTGESAAVAKSTNAITDAGAVLAERIGMVHMGTAVTSGRGSFIVTATGVDTEVGHIGTLLTQIADRATPLEAKLARLSRVLLAVVLVMCIVITVAGMLRGNGWLYMLEVGISLAIAAVPEGLLAVTTMTLAVGMLRMAKMNALVRRLPAVESLGSTTVICTDKTGTLTRNEMTIRALVVGGQRLQVTGSGYGLVGEIQYDGYRIDVTTPALSLALRIGTLCNDAQIDRSGAQVAVLGDPTEAAFLVAAAKAGLDRAALQLDFPRIAELPFSSETKLMATVHRTKGGALVSYVKGAPAAVFAACDTALGSAGVVPFTNADRVEARASNDLLAGEALRVLALAYRELPAPHDVADLTHGLTYVGLVGMIDPLRPEAHDTITTCRKAGIRVVMITGDQEATAAEIARQLGIDRGPQGEPLRTVHARSLVGLDSAGWLDIVATAAVFARTSPAHKLSIVDALQRLGHIVAMTGDGVNDAPALRQADVGIAMGIRGTEIAKEAADIVITDDNFATIVSAVEQGRVIVQNILHFIHYLFSSNLAEILTVFAAIMLGWPLPLGVLQILWLNLVTDVFPAMALALEPSAADVMSSPPRDPAQPLLTRRFAWLITWQGILLAGCTLTAFAIGMRWYGIEGAGERHAVTIAFMTLALTQVVHAFNARSRTASVFTSRLFTNGWLWAATALCLGLQIAAVVIPTLRAVLGTVPLSRADWTLVAGCSLAPLVVIELVKLVGRLRAPTATSARRAANAAASPPAAA